MPTVAIRKDLLLNNLGTTLVDEEFEELCFAFGIELDGIIDEADKSGKQQILYKIEVPANRYDLLCLEGICQALSVYLKKEKMPLYHLTNPKSYVEIFVKPNTAQVRPYVVAALLRDISFSEESYASFIDLQEKLHQNLCKKRSLVAIGTHDFDTLEQPFTYDAQPPSDIKFRPLNESREFSADELMQLYSKDSHLKQYLHLLRGKKNYPVIYDRKQVVLSLPPVINGNHSKITLRTKNVFIECTATDKHKASIVLDTLVCMFSRYCQQPYTVEPVKVHSVNGQTSVWPQLSYHEKEIDVCKANKILGICLSESQAIDILHQMGYQVKSKCTSQMTAVVPPTRHDVLHACDVYEDLAIGYGYTHIPRVLPKTNAMAQQFGLNKLTNQLRCELAQSGFTEALSFLLCSFSDLTVKLKKTTDVCAVHIANPKTADFQVTRTTLLPGLLHTIAYNKNLALPLRLFEIADVVLKDAQTETGAKNERHLAVVNYNKTPGFEIIHGILDHIMKVLKVNYGGTHGYQLKSSDQNMYFPGCCAAITINDLLLGYMGVLHPEVILAFDLNHACAAFEINMEFFENCY